LELFTRSLTPKKAWLCTAINQGAFPGMGTIMAGRRIGYLQVVVMVAGFILSMMFLQAYAVAGLRYATHPNGTHEEYVAVYRPYVTHGKWGFALVGATWLWALVSSLSILRQARREAKSLTGPPTL